MMEKLVFVSTLYPQTHYSRFLVSSLQRLAQNFEVIVYAEKGHDLDGHKLLNVVQVFDQKPYFFLQIVRQILKDKPKIVHLQHEASMYGGISTVWLFPILGLLLRLLGKKVVITFHAVVYAEQIDEDFLRIFSFPTWNPVVRITRLFFSYLYRTSSFLADCILVHSNYMKEVLCQNYNIDPSKVTVTSIGVLSTCSYEEKMGHFLSDPILTKLAGKRVILFFGYVVRRKGLEYLVEAIDDLRAEMGDLILVLAGGSIPYQLEYPAQLQEEVNRRGLSDVVLFTSFLSEKEVNELFYLCQIVVLPYVYSISSSLPLSFALQYDKPVVASEIGTLKEEVRLLDCGLLVPPRNSKALRESLKSLLVDDTLRETKISNIRCSKAERTWDAMALKTIKVYQGC